MSIKSDKIQPDNSTDQEALKRLRAIMEHADQFIGLLSPAGRLLEINTRVLEKYGLKRAEVIGKHLWETSWWQDVPEARERLQQAVQQAAQGENVAFEAKVSNLNGELVPITFSLQPIRDTDGIVSYLLPEAHNNADLEKTIAQLQQSQRLLKQANHIASLGYWTWELANDQVQISDELTRIFAQDGPTRIDNYQDLMRFVHPEDRVVVRRTIQSALELKRDFVAQFRINRQDGEVRTLRTMGQIVRDESDKPVKVIGTVQDITEIKSLESRLTDSEKRYRYLVQEMPDTGVVLYDPELIVFLADGKTIENHLGEKTEAVGKPVYEFLCQLLGEAPEQENLRFFKDVFEGQTHSYEQISGMDCYAVNLVPLRNEEDEIYAGMAVLRDITQRVRVAEKLSTMANQLKMLNQMGQVVASNRNSQEIFQEVMERVREIVGAQGVFIFLEKNGLLLIEAEDEENNVDLRGQGMPATEGIAGQVYQQQKSIILSGEACQTKLFKPLAKSLGYNPRSFIAVPITWQDKKFGVFEAVHAEEGKFDRDHLELVESAVTWMAIAHNNSLQHDLLERRLAESETTSELLGEILSASLTLDSVLQHVVEAGKNIIPSVDWAALHLLDERNNQLLLEAVTGVNVSAEEYSLRPGLGIAGRVIETGQLINVGDVSQDDRVAGFPRRNQGNSLVVAPIHNRESAVIGTITLHSGTTNQFTSEDENLLKLLADQAGLAIENARLYEAAEHRRQVAQIQRERLRQLTRQTVNAQEEERARLARELHDEAGQSLTALKISLEMLANGLPANMRSEREAVQEAAQQAGRTLENLRSMAHNLRPPALDRLGLNLALAGLCEQFENMTQIRTIFNGMETLPRLRNSHEITLYRFVQEALTNVAKHAGAELVRVWLDTQTGLLEIHVQDDGKGMDVNPLDLHYGSQEGMGIASMEERLRIIGGDLEVRTKPGEGTQLCARLKLQLREDPP